MSKREKVLPTWKELKADLKEMTFKQKMDHLWTYYSSWLWVLVLVGVIVAVIITGVVNKNKKLVVAGLLVNVSMEQRGYNYLSTGYEEKLGLDGKKNFVEVSATDFTSLADPTSSEDNYYASMQLMNLAAAERLDYAIMDHLALTQYLSWEEGLFLDLRDCFTEEEMAELAEKDMLFYAAGVDEEGDIESIEVSANDPRRVPVAIKMSKTQFGQDNLVGDEYYFVIIAKNATVTQVVAFWRYIMDWKL